MIDFRHMTHFLLCKPRLATAPTAIIVSHASMLSTWLAAYMSIWEKRCMSFLVPGVRCVLHSPVRRLERLGICHYFLGGFKRQQKTKEQATQQPMGQRRRVGKTKVDFSALLVPSSDLRSRLVLDWRAIPCKRRGPACAALAPPPPAKTSKSVNAHCHARSGDANSLSLALALSCAWCILCVLL